MGWIDGRERAKFEREQAELRVKYLAAGMSEEQIQKCMRLINPFTTNVDEKQHTRKSQTYKRLMMTAAKMN